MYLSYKGIQPSIDSSAYVAPGAVIIGDVIIGPESSIWFGTIVRADVHYIRIGAQTNIEAPCGPAKAGFEMQGIYAILLVFAR